MTWGTLRLASRIIGLGMVWVFALSLSGCAEKKTCFFQCYEPQLEGYRDDRSCGFVKDLTEEECAAFECIGERPPRHAWGEVPSWCDPERYERELR